MGKPRGLPKSWRVERLSVHVMNLGLLAVTAALGRGTGSHGRLKFDAEIRDLIRRMSRDSLPTLSP